MADTVLAMKDSDRWLIKICFRSLVIARQYMSPINPSSPTNTNNLDLCLVVIQSAFCLVFSSKVFYDLSFIFVFDTSLSSETWIFMCESRAIGVALNDAVDDVSLSFGSGRIIGRF